MAGESRLLENVLRLYHAVEFARSILVEPINAPALVGGIAKQELDRLAGLRRPRRTFTGAVLRAGGARAGPKRDDDYGCKSKNGSMRWPATAQRSQRARKHNDAPHCPRRRLVQRNGGLPQRKAI